MLTTLFWQEAGSSEERISEVKKALALRFNVKDMGELHYFLGIKIVQDQRSGDVWLGQQVYTDSIIESFGMKNGNQSTHQLISEQSSFINLRILTQSIKDSISQL